jgi:predicted O-methyltransferase YrrM
VVVAVNAKINDHEPTNKLIFSSLDMELRDYAIKNNVPIIQDDGLAMLESIIRIKRPKKILEIGCAIGYSAIRMTSVLGSIVYTIERNEEMYNQAIENVKKANLSDKIHIIFKDALEAYDLVKDNTFDLIFIDAAKAQYMKFFNLYTPLLRPHGVVVCDNMGFHGLVDLANNQEEYMKYSRGVRGIIRKMAHFHDELLAKEDFDTTLFEVGDGIAISVKK